MLIEIYLTTKHVPLNNNYTPVTQLTSFYTVLSNFWLEVQHLYLYYKNARNILLKIFCIV
jgi:hypothetical protein